MDNRNGLYRMESIEIDVTGDKFILENYSGHHAIFSMWSILGARRCAGKTQTNVDQYIFKRNFSAVNTKLSEMIAE